MSTEDPRAEGYGAEASEIDDVWNTLVGDRDVDDDMEWWTHLSSRGALLAAVQTRIADERARLAAAWSREGDSLAVIARRIGMSRARAQALVARGRGLLLAEAG